MSRFRPTCVNTVREQREGCDAGLLWMRAGDHLVKAKFHVNLRNGPLELPLLALDLTVDRSNLQHVHEIPLWVAEFLAVRGKVSIVTPDYLTVESMSSLLSSERAAPPEAFLTLPFDNFFPVCKRMLKLCGLASSPVSSLLNDLELTRREKIFSMLKSMDWTTKRLDITGMCSSELESVRAQLFGRLRFVKELGSMATGVRRVAANSTDNSQAAGTQGVGSLTSTAPLGSSLAA